MITLDFTGKVALITGAGSGFGAATAQLLASAGATIVVVDRNKERVAAVLEGLDRSKGQTHHCVIKDLRPAKAGAETVSETVAVAKQLDIVVNSAGVCHFNKITEITPDEWDEVLETDLRALHFISVAAAEVMDAKRGGRIINLGSNAGRKGRALSAHYAAAKAGVANLTESLALAYGPRGITVNTVCPAVVLTHMWEQNFSELGRISGKTPEQLSKGWTDLTPLKRLGTVEDVANLVAFLASDKAAFITGQTINVCGGFMLTC